MRSIHTWTAYSSRRWRHRIGRYGGENHPALQDVDPRRDALEFDLLQAAVRDGKPFLGICRGCQVVNVGFGGTLYVHLPDQRPGAVDHDQVEQRPGSLSHHVEVLAGTRSSEILLEHLISVNSHHHQAIWELGAGLRATAVAEDGLMEEWSYRTIRLAWRYNGTLNACRIRHEGHVCSRRFVESAVDYP